MLERVRPPTISVPRLTRSGLGLTTRGDVTQSHCSHTALRVVLGHSAVRYFLDAYIVGSEDFSSTNAKAAVTAYAMKFHCFST